MAKLSPLSTLGKLEDYAKSARKYKLSTPMEVEIDGYTFEETGVGTGKFRIKKDGKTTL